MNPFEGMSGLTRNPLGIIAVFLGILYGIAGLLLAVDSRPLTDFNQTVLTWLVFLFPFVSLAVFSWLVSKHHAKLYSPHDYRTDEGFFGSVQRSTDAEASAKLDAEVAAEEEAEARFTEGGVNPHSDDAPVDPSGEEDFATGTAQHHVTRRAGPVSGPLERRRKIYLAESLLLDRLSREFESLYRQSKLTSKSGRTILLDAVAKQGEDFYLIEVICAQYERTVPNRARDIAFQLGSLQAQFGADAHVKTIICVVWLDDRPPKAEDAVEQARRVFQDIGLSDIDIRQYSFSELQSPSWTEGDSHL